MTLKDEVMHSINRLFSKNKLDIKLNSLLFFRPVIREPPFEHMEVINDKHRLSSCSPVCVVFEIVFGNRRMEYESKYINENGIFSLQSFKLRYCDFFSEEEPLKIMEKMEQPVKLFLLYMSSILQLLSSGKKA